MLIQNLDKPPSIKTKLSALSLGVAIRDDFPFLTRFRIDLVEIKFCADEFQAFAFAMKLLVPLVTALVKQCLDLQIVIVQDCLQLIDYSSPKKRVRESFMVAKKQLCTVM